MPHTVLFVDDEPNILESFRRAFRSQPFEVRVAESGDQALAILDSEDIALVVTDHQMPGMTGTDLLTKICEEHPETIRFILTGNATLDVALDGINNGAISSFFIKPCNTTDLAIRIRQALEQKDLIRQTGRLLRKSRRQDALLDQMERENPGITQVARSATGSIILTPSGKDYKTLMEELNKALEEEI